MSRGQVVDFLTAYARSFDAPVLAGTTVLAAAPHGDGWRVVTDHDTWRARNLVVASGHCDTPSIPDLAADLAPELHQVAVTGYRNPRSLPPGGVLVVGASASGAQLAEEIRAAGREVVLAVGRHNRLPRRYRGRDILWWLDRMGILDRTLADMPSPESARREPSLQLVGRPDGGDLDLGVLAGRGVRLAGRLVGADGFRVRFAADLAAVSADADHRLERTLDRIDRFVDAHGLAARFPAGARPAPLALADSGPASLDLREAGIATVLWSTGFRRTYPWLDAPVLDGEGEIRQVRGRTPLPGLYVLGLQFMTRRRSSFIDGVGRDAEEIAEHLAGRRRAGARAA
jgi:putative flavoprotein involved in K+ transport